MGNGKPVPNYSEFTKLTKSQRDFYIYERLGKLDGLDRRYASKLVERIVYGFVALSLMGIGTAIVSLAVQAF